MKKLIIFYILLLFINSLAFGATTSDTLSAPTQISPISDLTQENTSIVNNNSQILQSNINGLYATLNTIGGYFTNGVLNTSNGGTGLTTGIPAPANLSFEYSGQVDGTGWEYTGTSLVPHGATDNYRFLSASDGSGNYVQVWTAKFIKVSGINTITVYGRIWSSIATSAANLKVDIGGQNSNVTGSNAQHTPEWKSFTINVSSLTNGTIYDVTASLKITSAGTSEANCSNIIGFGS